jgi:AAA domain
MSIPRPYLNKTIVELETLFADPKQDTDVLLLLEAELKHRSVKRAVALASRVREAIASASQANPTALRQGNLFAPPPQAPKTVAPVVPKTSSKHPSPSRSSGETHPPKANAHQSAVPKHVPSISLPPLLADNEGNSSERPKSDDTSQSILHAWIAMEALSPQSYKRPENLAGDEKRRVAQLSEALPWAKGEKSRPNHRLFYEIILGAVDMDAAGKGLVAAFGATEERERPGGQKAAIGSIIVDSKGVPLEEKGIALSSFAWALPKALRKALTSLSRWPEVEPKAIDAISRIVRTVDEDENPLPIDLAKIEASHVWLVQSFGLDPAMVEPPSFAIRVYHHIKAQGDPEPQLLNSFFLNDLARALRLAEDGKPPPALSAYLGKSKPAETVDLLNDLQKLEAAVAPDKFPLARWAMGPERGLVLLQQAAVNLARKELATAGVFAVNGPPGTGKTTLLRDIVADLVTRRASAMAKFDEPSKAFRASGEKMKAGSGFLHLYKLDPGLKGFEMLVASSNNKAVENISKELPGSGAIAQSDLRYFQSVSDRLFNPPPKEGDEEAGRAEPLKTWGLIAAVMGNRSNIGGFRQAFWWDRDFAMRLYLKASKGDDIREALKDDQGTTVGYRTPKIIETERPPAGEDSAKAAWNLSVKRFRKAEQRAKDAIAAADRIRTMLHKLPADRNEVDNLKADFDRTAEMHGAASEVSRAARERCALADAALQKVQLEKQAHMLDSPGFFARLFRSQAAVRWKSGNENLESSLNASVADQNAAQKEAKSAASAVTELSGKLAVLRQKLKKAADLLASSEVEVEQAKRALGSRFIGTDFISMSHEVRQAIVPWLDAETHQLREDLFKAALDLHRSFLGAAARPMFHNLSALFDLSKDAGTSDPDKQAMLPDLWSTLFLVVPVLSTTFASVDRMLGKLGPESIGWLLVDEAGQALPQAAVGAIMRSQRAMIVGDPIQVPPVVTLPQHLVDEISAYFRVTASIWAAPMASAQTLADKASRHQAVFEGDTDRKVGAPLLVHRRCEEPMFGIANKIAYGGKMVTQVKATDGGLIRKALGPSRWIDVEGEASSKWCAVEGEKVVELLQKVADSGIKSPDVFVVTPFRVVANEIRLRLRRETALFRKLELDLGRWLDGNVGTVHTVQGREADTVIFILGAPNPSQNGARQWAGSPPNLANVAISRAKHNFYVVGSRSAWRGAGSFSILAAEL